MPCDPCSGVDKYYVGDIGTIIDVNTCTLVSGATIARLIVQKPDSISFDWDGTSIDITNIVSGNLETHIQYTVTAGDFDQVGQYMVVAYIVTPTWSGHGTMASFAVHNVFE